MTMTWANLKELRQSENFNKIVAAVAAFAVIVIGTIFLIATRAATTATSIEAEQGTATTNAKTVTDASASGGKYINFGSAVTPPPPPPPSGSLCGWRTAPPATYKHVVWIIEENHTYSQAIGQSTTPYLTSLATKNCASGTHWDDNYGTMPSLPHYIALATGSNQGITTDGKPADFPPITADNIFRQVRTAGLTEKQYMEDMPANCTLTGSSPYAVRHNAAAFMVGGTDRTACQKSNVPMGSATTGNLGTDLKNNALPNFAILVPNVCHQTHSPCDTTSQLQQGDDFLKTLVQGIVATPDYQAGNTIIFVLYDENTYIPNAIIAPSVKPGFVTNSSISHFSLLHTTEEILGINKFLLNAGGAPSMRTLFNL